MDAQFRCENESRRRRVADPAVPLNGIDYLEVLDGGTPAGLPRQQALLVHFLKALPAAADPGALTTANVRIEREPRAALVAVAWARRAADVTAGLPDGAGGALTAAHAAFFTALPDADRVLVVLTTAEGDFSPYTLRLVTSPTDDAPPPPLDPRLAAVRFSFKVECPSDFDCRDEAACAPEPLDEPEIDYLAKDYASFRRLMLDRLSVLLPGWTERSPADLQVALVELLAYAGDHLSYYQDAVATEAYLGTARSRVSVRRHARLLDYVMHDGCNARAWVHLEVEPGGGADGAVLPAGAELRTRDDGGPVFETMHDVELRASHNEILFYTWGDTACCLPAGATRATLRDDGLALAEGDVLVFEEVRSPTTGLTADADPARRHAVRLTAAEPAVDPLDATAVVEVAWHEQDALPFALCLSAVIGGAEVADVSVARGNVALADHGGSIEGEALVPEVVPGAGRYRPRLQEAGVTFAVPYTHVAALAAPAAVALRQDPRTALPAVELLDADEAWQPQRDLLGSDRFAAEFVVEAERDGRATLRFGDGVMGKAPTAGTAFAAAYRVGSGPAGNVGAEAISQAVGVPGITRVRNPLPAVGGAAPESMEEVRQYAPQAFRVQQRAVTEADYAEVAGRHPEVQKAAAVFRWTGSWYTVFLTVDRRGGLPVRADARFLRELRAHLERFRLAGYDLEINDPVYVPLDLLLVVCAAPGHFRSDVKRSLLDAFSRFERPGGGRGFFHPDRFTFGQPVYLSQIYEAAMAVEGVASVEVRRFQRWGEAAAGEIAAGVLKAASLEIVRLDNDPSLPGNGRLEVEMQGGL